VQPENIVMEQGVETRADVQYAVENPADFRAATRVWSEILPKMGEGFSSTNQVLGIKFNPDWDQIATLLVARKMFIGTARVNNRLDGYQIWIINDVLWAQGQKNGCLWTMNGGRKVGVDQLQLFNVCRSYMRSLGVTSIVASAIPGSAAHKLLERAELKPIEMMMGGPLWRS
jgi:hypothetical protein